MKHYSGYSFWLESAGDDLRPRPALAEHVPADVAIVGAGFSGLWTAYYLLRADPGLRVVLVEREIAGFGASGRNGAWCSGVFPLSAETLETRYGAEAAQEVYRAMYGAVDEVGRVAAEELIDAQFRKGGELLIARGTHHMPAIEHEAATLRRLDVAGGCALLDEAQVRTRVRIAGARAALFNPNCAVIHPGRLVRGLARAVERRGGVIYERTPVLRVVEGPQPRLITPHGEIAAGAVVLAGEAYLTRLPAYRRHVLPVYSLIVLTEPLSEAQWDEIGWQQHEGICSARYTVDYLSRTADGRLLFGGRGAPYHFGSQIADAYDHHEPTHEMLRRNVVSWFPMLEGVRFTHAWGGPLGVPRDWMPTMSFDRRSGIGFAGGYTGQGVATTNLAGRVLADLLREQRTALTALPMATHRVRRWEPEPLRWIAARAVQEGLVRVDDRAERTGVPPSGRTLPELLARH